MLKDLNAILDKIRRIETIRFLKRDYCVIRGTIRRKPDYDDAWLLACSAHSTRIFDLGANIGQASILELYSENVKELLLVDPNPKALSLAAENLITNHLIDRVRFTCAFVSDQADQSVEFWTVGIGAAGSMWKQHAKTASKKNKSFIVPTTSIDRLSEWYGVPDLIKIDIEGAESLALMGCQKTVRDRKTRLLIEMHSNPELPMVENASRILNWCAINHYKAWYLKKKIEIDRPEILSSRGRCHILLQPAEWSFPEWLLSIEQSATPESILKLIN